MDCFTVDFDLDGKIVVMSPAMYGSSVVVFGDNDDDNEEEVLFLLLI